MYMADNRDTALELDKYMGHRRMGLGLDKLDMLGMLGNSLGRIATGKLLM